MRVLIAEDNQMHLMILKEYLKDANVEILSAKNGLEAWGLWKKMAPEIVITDINMPDMDGYELIQKIREYEIGTYTHIITITSSQEIDELEKSFLYGSDDFMVKPIQEKELIYRLKVGQRISRNLDKKSFFDTLARLTELRDQDTGGHIHRIGAFTHILALSLSEKEGYEDLMNEAYIKNLMLSSVLHDIGKIGIDDELLKSTAIYTDEERMRMQKHTIIGSRLLEEILMIHPNMRFLDFAVRIARSHHERYDGKGYPDGLKKEEIPLEARIVAVADVFDALISKRAYKPSFTLEKTLEIMQLEKGKHFDPVIIDVLMENIDRIMNEVYDISHGGKNQ